MEKSFSSIVKEELCELNIANQSQAKSELAAMLLFCESIEIDKIVLSTSHAFVAQRIQALFKKAINETVFIDLADGKYKYTIPLTYDMANKTGVFFDNGEISIDEDVYESEEQIRAFLRGAFVAGGTITSPEKTYSCELVTYDENVAYLAGELLLNYEISSNTVRRKKYYITYIKENSLIADFLNIVGAHKSMMEYMNTYIEKTLSNKINRQNNFHIANLNKTIDVAVKQRNAIKKLMNTSRWERLDDTTKKLCEYRIENMDASFEEIGKMMTPVMSKSTVSRRLGNVIKAVSEE